MARAVLINERRNELHEIELAIALEKNEIYKILRAKLHFWDSGLKSLLL